MPVSFFLESFAQHHEREAIVWKGKAYSYGWLRKRVAELGETMAEVPVRPGEIAMVAADFSPESVALFMALVAKKCIVVPFSSSGRKDEYASISRAQQFLSLDKDDRLHITRMGFDGRHDLYETLRTTEHPGLVIFSSGSTGELKAAVHDIIPLLNKFKVKRHAWRTIPFLLYDHIGGMNTMLYTLSNGGTLILPPDRKPASVLSAVERHKVELLPVSPTFINLILVSKVYEHYDLSSLKTVTYGTEPMPRHTLERFHELFPKIKLVQTYGLTELGILRSKSEKSDSLWVKVGGEDFQTRVLDGVLQIKSKSAMLGYLNAESPFTADGWFNTGDVVEVKGEYVRFLGRKSDIINIGGEKVYPTEVENVILGMPEIAEVTVHGERHAIMGSIVCCTIRPGEHVSVADLKKKVKKFCAGKLEQYKIPVKITVDYELPISDRQKKIRKKLSNV